MDLTAYRRVLRRPGVASLLVVAVLARIPITAAPVVLTLHVVLDLHRGFAESGLLAAAFAVGAAVGAPLLGRAVDRSGLRPVLVVTTAVDGLFWFAAPLLGFAALLAAGLVAGLLSIPVFTLTRQALTAMLAPEQRQAGYALDSMSVELSFAVGPAAGIALLTSTSSTTTLLVVAALVTAAGVALLVLDPPVTAPGPTRPAAGHVPVRRWLNARVVAVLLASFGATFVVVGTDTALTATMRELGRLNRLGLVFALWCLASLAGGFVHGAARRAIPVPLMLALLAALCLPVALARSWWGLTLLIIPTGLFCAPLIAVTAERITALTPAGVRGLVVGVHGSALTVGNAVGAPVAGLVVDTVAPRLGFVAVGAGGLVLAAVAFAVDRRARRPGDAPPAGPPDSSAVDAALARTGALSA